MFGAGTEVAAGKREDPFGGSGQGGQQAPVLVGPQVGEGAQPATDRSAGSVGK